MVSLCCFFFIQEEQDYVCEYCYLKVDRKYSAYRKNSVPTKIQQIYEHSSSSCEPLPSTSSHGVVEEPLICQPHSPLLYSSSPPKAGYPPIHQPSPPMATSSVAPNTPKSLDLGDVRHTTLAMTASSDPISYKHPTLFADMGLGEIIRATEQPSDKLFRRRPTLTSFPMQNRYTSAMKQLFHSGEHVLCLLRLDYDVYFLFGHTCLLCL